MSLLNSIESKNEEKKVELEKNILALKTLIAKYDADYNQNMELMTSISDNLMNLLRNVSVRQIFFPCFPPSLSPFLPILL